MAPARGRLAAAAAFFFLFSSSSSSPLLDRVAAGGSWGLPPPLRARSLLLALSPGLAAAAPRRGLALGFPLPPRGRNRRLAARRLPLLPVPLELDPTAPAEGGRRRRRRLRALGPADADAAATTATATSLLSVAPERTPLGASLSPPPPPPPHHHLHRRPAPPPPAGTETRRGAVARLSSGAAIAAIAAIAAAASRPAVAGVPELDGRSGQLYTPKSQMLSGRGSDAARGIIPERRGDGGAASSPSPSGRPPRPGEAVQAVYGTRFVAYLSRFLLNYDPAAHAWWVDRGAGDGWDAPAPPPAGAAAAGTAPTAADLAFAEFCESVEIGLSDYFAGPYGSYSSLAAAAAGLSAASPARSQREERRRSAAPSDASGPPPLAKQGVLNLYALLKARYTSVSAKRQLAILFSFVDDPLLQPVAEISALLGEADNSTVSAIGLDLDLEGERGFAGEGGDEGEDAGDVEGTSYRRRRTARSRTSPVADESTSRTSPRRGGGYSEDDPPVVTIDPPPALGDAYPRAVARPVVRPTGRVLRVDLADGGAGYREAPSVRVVQGGTRRPCQAAALLGRDGSVESVVVLDPGFGYGGAGSGQVRNRNRPPAVRIDPPPKDPAAGGGVGVGVGSPRPARASAVLEHAIVGIEVVRGGAGYVRSEPPDVRVSPPREDPDWFLSVREQPELRMVPLGGSGGDFGGVRARVAEMRRPDGNVAYSAAGSGAVPPAAAAGPRPRIDGALLERIRRDPLELLPQWVRPRRRAAVVPAAAAPGAGKGVGPPRTVYTVPVLDAVPQGVAVMNPRYRAYDPVFGGVGMVPVTRGALELRVDEYARLALSGAVCTVVVRTLLNPLELVKTKQQLGNDPGLLEYVAWKKYGAPPPAPATREGATTASGEGLQPGLSLSRENSTAREAAGETSTATLAPAAQIAGAAAGAAPAAGPVGTVDMLRGIAELRGPLALFQSADITFLASLAFGSFGFGATELFRRSFTAVFFAEGGAGSGGSEVVLLVAAALATVLTAAVAAPFELLRVRSMGLLEPTKWTEVLREFLSSKSKSNVAPTDLDLKSLKPKDVLPLWSGFAPTLSRELPFAIAKFLTFDLLARTMVAYLNSQTAEGALPIQVGVGPLGLAISAASGAVAGIAGAIVSHPADLILTKTSARGRSSGAAGEPGDWKDIVKDMMSQDGGIANLFVGLGARSTFFFLVIGLQFFLYDYVKNLFQVGSDDLSLVLDVFYAVRAGLDTEQS